MGIHLFIRERRTLQVGRLMNDVQALLIDLDGVLRLWEPDNAIQAELQGGLPAGAIFAAAFAPDLLNTVITGHVDDPTWRSMVVERLAVHHPQANATLAVSMWSESAGQVDYHVLDIVRRARKRVTVVLVTNATSRLSSDLDRLGLHGEFDHIVNSADIGAAKPGIEIFDAALQMASVSPHQAVFVDDTEANVKAASLLGFNGHLYTDPSRLDETLRRTGVLRD